MDNMPFEQKVTLALAAFMPENIEKEKFFAFFDIEEHNDLNELIRHGWVSENVQAHTINVHPIVKYLIAGILNSDNDINKNVVDKFFISMSKGIEYTYPFEMDVNKFKYEFACLIADLEEAELEKNKIEEANEKQEAATVSAETENSDNAPAIKRTVNNHKILKGFAAAAASAVITVISVLGYKYISK